MMGRTHGRCLAILIVASLVLALDNSTLAETSRFDVGAFLQLCKKEVASGVPGVCYGYVAGTAQMMGANGAALKHAKSLDKQSELYLRGAAVCPDTSDGELPPASTIVHDFIEWAESHPDKWSDSESTGVAVWLSGKWPCPHYNLQN
jgi:hypothetical protein